VQLRQQKTKLSGFCERNSFQPGKAALGMLKIYSAVLQYDLRV
jgi:hypothetical protein